MAMTFTLVSHLREQLSALVTSRIERRKKEETERERQALQVRYSCLIPLIDVYCHKQAEETRTRGTPVTIQNFMTWKAKFDKEMAAKRAREEEEKLKGLSPKEREEYKKFATRLTGVSLCYFNSALSLIVTKIQDDNCLSVIKISAYRTTVWLRKALFRWT